MTINLIHLSDLHYLQGRDENHDVVLIEFFKDLSEQIKKSGSTNNYLVFSGDIIQAGENSDDYEIFIKKFDSKLNSLGITKKYRICVPGNHDASREQIAETLIEHEGVVSQKLDERHFNDYVSKYPNVLTKKFSNYLDFEQKFADFGVGGSDALGHGWSISDEIGVYCLNTALCSSGGLVGTSGKPLADNKRLAIATRNLHSWLAESKSKIKILVMHHPLSWLTEWAEKELLTLLNKEFNLCLSGHNHDQSTYHSLKNGSYLVECSAPALFTTKTDNLGYAVISISKEVGIHEITYRQWTKHYTFVSGVNFSNSDNGKVVINLMENTSELRRVNENINGFIERHHSKRLNDALMAFSTQPIVWVTPVLSLKAEVDRDAKSAAKIDLNNLIKVPKSTRIRAPHQFGLTCLAFYMVKESWVKNTKVWLYLDARNLKSINSSIQAALDAELQLIGFAESEVSCVVLDSWIKSEKNSVNLLDRIAAKFPNIPIICMESFEVNNFLSVPDEALDKFGFDLVYLWSLPRVQIRELINRHNEIKYIGDEDEVTAKIVSDLEVLNLHRTPLNCLTLLKVSEFYFDDSPVNRSEIIKKVLFLLFNVDEIPNYKSRPDLKDCEYVLGYFIESMLKVNNFHFTREHFLDVLKICCNERLIDLEIHVVFDVLLANNILVGNGSLFSFRFSYWIYYFAAQRMHHNENFAAYIFENMNYAKFPEIIEFYTGIDRQREDALKVLLRDIKVCQTQVQNKFGFPDDFNPYKNALWTSSPEILEKMQKEINEGVQESNLPAFVKDHYADRSYDRARPYSQDIRNILEEHTFVYLVQTMRAASKALRNSDYVNPDTKKELLSEIMNCWNLVSKIGIVLIPILAEHGTAHYDGFGFQLVGNFAPTLEERMRQILITIPKSIVNWGKDDLYSQKMGPLLIDQASMEVNDLKKHELMLLLILQRPRNWKPQIEKYIASLGKNSFYLFDVYRTLKNQYTYSYASQSTLRDMDSLIKISAKAHNHKSSGVKLVSQALSKLITPIIDGGKK